MEEQNNFKDLEDNSAMVSEPIAGGYMQSQTVEHLRHKGVETLMKIDDPTSLQIAIAYIQHIYGHKVDASSGNHKALLKQTLGSYGLYKDGWDDEDGKAILPKIIENTGIFIDSTSNYLLDNWSLFPCSNGTLKLEIHQTNKNAGINIGLKEFSYYIHANGEESYGKAPISVRRLVDILTQVYYG